MIDDVVLPHAARFSFYYYNLVYLFYLNIYISSPYLCLQPAICTIANNTVGFMSRIFAFTIVINPWILVTGDTRGYVISSDRQNSQLCMSNMKTICHQLLVITRIPWQSTAQDCWWIRDFVTLRQAVHHRKRYHMERNKTPTHCLILLKYQLEPLLLTRFNSLRPSDAYMLR